jgi:hypothetical protein
MTKPWENEENHISNKDPTHFVLINNYLKFHKKNWWTGHTHPFIYVLRLIIVENLWELLIHLNKNSNI